MLAAGVRRNILNEVVNLSALRPFLHVIARLRTPLLAVACVLGMLAKAGATQALALSDAERAWIAAHLGRRIAPPAHYLPSTEALVEAARDGLGWGMNPIALVRGHLRHGRLAPLAAQASLDVPLVWQVSRVMAPALEPLTRAVRAAAGRQLVTPESPAKEKPAGKDAR